MSEHLVGIQLQLSILMNLHLENAKQDIEVIFEKGLSMGKISADQAEKAHQNLSYENDLAKAAGNADLIIEAVPEIACD